MVEDNKQYAYFTLVGSFDPAEVTARIELEPTESWKQGDISPKTQMERRFSRWNLRSRLPESGGLEEHMRDVLAQLDAKRDEVRNVTREFGGCMQLVGYFYACFPGLHVDRDVSERLGWYGLAVDCDFYGLYSHRREDTD
jgi:hypothetical protein